MSWAAKRVTKRKEDIAYSLLGIFGVVMPMIYGEGDQAFSRLQQEIIKKSRDDSILAWGLGLTLTESTSNNSNDMISAGVLAAAPSDFANCGHIVSREHHTMSRAFTIVGGCLQVCLSLLTTSTGQTLGLLNCGPERNTEVVGIPLTIASPSGPFSECIRPKGRCSILLPKIKSEIPIRLIDILIERDKAPLTISCRNWLYIEESIETNLELAEVEPKVLWRRDHALIATGSDSSGNILQPILARFCPKCGGEGSCDFLVVFEFKTQGLQRRPQCYIMISSRATTLADLA
jgi:hypothetical protein